MLQIDSSLIVVFFMIWVLHFVLSKVFFNPVRKTIGKREARLRGNREACERALQENERRIGEINEGLKSARASAYKIRGELEKEAIREKGRLLEEIQAESRARVEKARKKLEAEIELSKRKLASEAEVLAEKIEERLLHS